MTVKNMSKEKKISVELKKKPAKRMKTRGTGAATKGLMYYDKT